MNAACNSCACRMPHASSATHQWNAPIHPRHICLARRGSVSLCFPTISMRPEAPAAEKVLPTPRLQMAPSRFSCPPLWLPPSCITVVQLRTAPRLRTRGVPVRGERGCGAGGGGVQRERERCFGFAAATLFFSPAPSPSTSSQARLAATGSTGSTWCDGDKESAPPAAPTASHCVAALIFASQTA